MRVVHWMKRQRQSCWRGARGCSSLRKLSSGHRTACLMPWNLQKNYTSTVSHELRGLAALKCSSPNAGWIAHTGRSRLTDFNAINIRTLTPACFSQGCFTKVFGGLRCRRATRCRDKSDCSSNRLHDFFEGVQVTVPVASQANDCTIRLEGLSPFNHERSIGAVREGWLATLTSDSCDRCRPSPALLN